MNRITLQHNRPVHLAGAMRIECVAGVAWLTQADRSADVFLRTGDTWELGRGEAVLVEALGAAQVVLHRTPGVWRRSMGVLAGVLSSWHERMRTVRVVRSARRRASLAG